MRVQPIQIQRIYAAGFGVAFTTLLALTAFNSVKVGGAVIPLILVALCDAVCLRLFRLAVIADEGGLVVRNYLRTYKLRWEEVAAFKLEPPPSRLVGWELMLVLVSGKALGLDAAKRSVRRGGDRDQVALDETRKRLAAWLPDRAI